MRSCRVRRMAAGLPARPSTRSQEQNQVSDASDRPRRAVQYLRMSTDMQRYSLDNQAAAIADYAAPAGFDIVRSYEDAGRTGVTARGRQGLANLMADVLGPDRDFDIILVLDVSRWGRFQDPDEAGHYEFLCRSAGVEVRYCSESFGLGPASSVMKQLKRVMAGEYSRELSDKVRRGRRRHESLGHSPGGRCPYGIQRQEMLSDETPGRMLGRQERKSRPEHSVRYAPGVAEEQDVVRSIFTMFVRQTLGNAAIAARLNGSGHPYHDGTPWTAERIGSVLHCDLLRGQQWGNKIDWRLGETQVPRSRDQWRLARTFAPVVPLRLFAAAQARRRDLDGRAGKTTAEMLDDLRRILKRHGRITPTLIEADDRSPGTARYIARFGTLTCAYGAIGYSGGRLGRGRNPDGSLMNKAEVLECLRLVAERYGRISSTIIRANRSLPAGHVIASLFGSLPKAYEAAGVCCLRAGGSGGFRLGEPAPQPPVPTTPDPTPRGA